MADRLLVWVGAGMLAAGLSAGTLAAPSVAVADDGADTGGTATSEATSGAEPAGGEPDPEPAESTETVDDSDPDGDEPAEDEPAEDERDEPRDGDRAEASTPPEDSRTVDPIEPDPQTTEPEEEAVEPPTDEVVVEEQPVGDTVTVTPPADTDAPVEEPSEKPDVVETIATAVSSAVTTLVNPFANDDTPVAPAAQPQAWTLLAAARREFETAFESPTLVEPAAVVENSLTYTPDLAFQDRIAMVVHEVFRVITRVTGVDVYATLGRLQGSGYPPFFLGFGLDTERTTWTAEDGTEWRVWEFRSPEPTEKKVVVLHGGGWVFEPGFLHWVDYTNMARQTGATVVVPLYPLATSPEGAATEVIGEAADFIAHHIELSGAENVSIYADSAGVTLAMSGVRELLRSGRPVPASMVLLSGVMDSSLENPDVLEVDDPMFDRTNLSAWDSHWFDGVDDRRDPLVSPLFYEDAVLQGMPPTTIYVGEREILYPDTLLLHQRAVELGAPISVVVGTGLLHTWPLSGLPLYSQTAAVRADIYRQLGLTDEETV